MKKLIQIEWLKVSRNRVFWITLGAYILTIIMILVGVRQAIISFNTNVSEATGGMSVLPTEIFKFPWVWHNLAFLAKFIKIFIAIVMILIVTNEFYYNTLRQNLINGMSRLEFVWSKFIDAVILAAFAAIILFLFGFVSGLINTPNLRFDAIFSKIHFVLGYFLMLVGYLSFVMMIAVLLRKAILSMGILIVYSYIIENIINWKFPAIGKFLPGEVFNGFILAPKTVLFDMLKVQTASNSIPIFNLVMTLVYTSLFFYITYLVLKKRDL